jgi:hypothetical protein
MAGILFDGKQKLKETLAGFTKEAEENPVGLNARGGSYQRSYWGGLRCTSAAVAADPAGL